MYFGPAEGLHDKFHENRIDSGWLEFYDYEDTRPEEVEPNKEEYYSYLRGAHDRLIYQEICEDTLPKIESIRGWEVGDDRVDQSHSPTGLAVALHVQTQVFKMETSEDDTFISKERYNFCEVTSIVPRTVNGSYDYFRKTQDLGNLEFVDVMPLRLIEPVSKGKGTDHSSSTIGKSRMAGVKQSFARDDLREEMYITNLLQDGCLLTNRSPEPKYLPSIMGGAGSPALYGSATNLFLYMQAYKGGGYSRVYGTSAQEIRDSLFQLETGRGYAVPHFTLKLRDKQEYLFGTYDEKVFVPSNAWIAQEKGRMPAPLYEVGTADNILASYEARLIAAKVLVTRTQAEMEVERTKRTNDILFGFQTVVSLKAKDKVQSKAGRQKFEGALYSNSAFANLLARTATGKDVKELMKDKSFKLITTGAREFTLAHAVWIHSGLKSDTYSFRDLLRCEDMFLRTEVSTEEDMKVSKIGRLWVREGKQVLTETKTKVGLWQVSPGLYDWAQQVGNKLVEERARLDVATLPRSTVANLYLQDREMVADDPLIVRKLKQATQHGVVTDTVCIITQDKRLCKTAADACGVRVLRVSTYAMPLLIKGPDLEESVNNLEGSSGRIGNLIHFPGNPRIIHTMVDTGSLAEMLMKHDYLDIGEGRPETYKFQSMRFFQDKKGRHEVISYVKTHQYDKISSSELSKLKDPNGNGLFEMVHPGKTLLKYLPKFESYDKGSSVSSKGSSSTRNSRTRKRSGFLPSEAE